MCVYDSFDHLFVCVYLQFIFVWCVSYSYLFMPVLNQSSCIIISFLFIFGFRTEHSGQSFFDFFCIDQQCSESILVLFLGLINVSVAGFECVLVFVPWGAFIVYLLCCKKTFIGYDLFNCVYFLLFGGLFGFCFVVTMLAWFWWSGLDL